MSDAYPWVVVKVPPSADVQPTVVEIEARLIEALGNAAQFRFAPSRETHEHLIDSLEEVHDVIERASLEGIEMALRSTPH